MYVPPAFAVNDVPQLQAFMSAHSFALLTSLHEGRLFATHLPLLVENGPASGAFDSLVGHVARANPQWRDLAAGEVLAVFSGPHSYISPTWYAAENVVPTWNYVAVHAYGTVELIEDETAVLEVLRRTVEVYERSQPQPWSYAEGDAFVRKLAGAVVAFRIRVTRLEGKWKLNQNHPAERITRVIAALSHQPDENSQLIAELMTKQERSS
jgi:transcriptional regulator